MPIRIEQMEIPFAPRSILRLFGLESQLVEASPERASTSATWKISRPQPLTRSPCSKLRMAESASFARREENPAVPPLRRAPPCRAHPDRTARRRSCSRLRDSKRDRRNPLNFQRHAGSLLPPERAALASLIFA